MNKIMLAIMALLSLSAQAEVDYSITTSARTYPQGLSVTADFGNSMKLWGADSGILYGYIRPSLSIQTSAIVNYGKAQLDFYPISFLGVHVAKEKGYRNLSELQGFDCQVLNCGSSLEKTTVGISAALALGPFKLVNLNSTSKLSYKTKELSIADEVSNLVVKSEDELETNISILGYQVDSSLMIGFLNAYYQSKENKQRSNMLMGLTSITSGEWSYQMGLGGFHNRAGKNHFSALFIMKWNGAKGLKLF